MLPPPHVPHVCVPPAWFCPGPFQQFAQRCHASVAQSLPPESSATDVNTAIGALWQKLPEADRQFYKSLHKQEREKKREKKRVSCLLGTWVQQELTLHALSDLEVKGF